MVNIAINGFGRIGRNFLRTILLDPEAKNKIKVSAINIGPANPELVAHMFKYDTLMGTYPGVVKMENSTLIVDGYQICIISECDPDCCNWGELGIEWVVDCSGCFTKREGALRHIEAGAQHVLISAPAHNEDIAIIPGVNDELFDKAKHKIVSMGSCTTNAFIPMVKVLHDAFTITKGYMTTVHAYTNTQVLLDVESSDARRSRAAALNIIPTTTGASAMLAKLMPELDGVIEAMALRVPVAKVSLIDLTVVTEKSPSVDAVHDAFIQLAKERMQGIIGLTFEPLVSSDFSGTNYSVVIDGQLTRSSAGMTKLFGWYDNEWGYSVRLKDFLVGIAG